MLQTEFRSEPSFHGEHAIIDGVCFAVGDAPGDGHNCLIDTVDAQYPVLRGCEMDSRAVFAGDFRRDQ